MDALLHQAASQVTTFAIRSGISLAGGFAIKQVSRYITHVPGDSRKHELELVSKRLDQKIKIIAARGNTTLNSTVQLTVSLRNDINNFGKRMSEANENHTGPSSKKVGSKDDTKAIIDDMRALLSRIEDAVPLISLALTTSGANLSSSLPATVSPSRLLQASSLLQSGDAEFARDPLKPTQIGPTFLLKLYTIFEGHSRHTANTSNITWQEQYAKCAVEVMRMPVTADQDHEEGRDLEYSVDYLYHLRVTEDLNDGRYHEELETKDAPKVGPDKIIRGQSRDVPVHNIARLFFSASGRLLNIEEARTPVLVLKLNHALKGPTKFMREVFAGQEGIEDPADGAYAEPGSQAAEENPADPDNVEWAALEMWSEDASESEEGDDDQEDADSTGEATELIVDDRPSSKDSDVDALSMQLQVLNMSRMKAKQRGFSQDDIATLSLLEYILRLSALQISEQASVLAASDERISLFLRDDNNQSRDRSSEEAAAGRRTSNTFATPSSSLFHSHEYIPGTQQRPKNRRHLRGSPPSSNERLPGGKRSPQSRLASLSTPQHNYKTPTMSGMIGARLWSSVGNSVDSPLASKAKRQSGTPRIIETLKADIEET